MGKSPAVERVRVVGLEPQHRLEIGKGEHGSIGCQVGPAPAAPGQRIRGLELQRQGVIIQRVGVASERRACEAPVPKNLGRLGPIFHGTIERPDRLVIAAHFQERFAAPPMYLGQIGTQ